MGRLHQMSKQSCLGQMSRKDDPRWRL